MHRIFKLLLVIITIIFASFFVYRIFVYNNVAVVDIIKKQQVSTIEKGFDDAQINFIQGIIREYISNNPSIIVDALANLEKQRLLESELKVSNNIAENKDKLYQDEDFPFLGNKNGQYVIVFFYDYQCSYCKKAFSDLNNFIQNDNDVKIILRPMPILGQISREISKVILALYKQNPDKIAAIHKDFMDEHIINSKSIDVILRKHGVDADAIRASADNQRVSDLLSQEDELLQSLSLNGVPAYIIDDKLISGVINITQLHENYKKSKQ